MIWWLHYGGGVGRGRENRRPVGRPVSRRRRRGRAIPLFVTHATGSPWYVVCVCARARKIVGCEYAGVRVRVVRAVARRRRRGWTTTEVDG